MYASGDFGAERKLLNRQVKVIGEGDKEKESCVARKLLLCVCSGEGDMELTFVHYMECVPCLETVSETMDCVCRRWQQKTLQKMRQK